MEQQTIDIINLYNNNASLKGIGRLLKTAPIRVKRILIENGIKLKTKNEANRKYQFDDTFFDNIDTEEKAYWLGFLYADGCIKKKGYVQLALVDKKPVYDFKKAIKAEHPVKKEANNRSRWNHKDDCLYFIRIGSKDLCASLVSKGCIPNKTKTLKFPTAEQVPVDLVRHFIRGYFDGDGSAGISRKRSNFSFSICSTSEFADGLLHAIARHGFDFYVIPDKSIFSIRSHGKAHTVNFLNWIYNDATIFLKRKQKIAKLMQELYEL